MNNIKAYDIVLIPSSEVIDLSIKVNRYFNEHNEPKIYLGRDSGVPHITLVFLGLKNEDLDKLINIVNNLVKNFNKQLLSVSGFETTWNGTSFNVEVSDDVCKLRDNLFTELKSLHSDIDINCFTKAQIEPSETHVSWVNNYLKKTDFWPHISLGKGNYDLNDIKFPIEFECSKIAIYELGYHCTCQKLVKEFELK